MQATIIQKIKKGSFMEGKKNNTSANKTFATAEDIPSNMLATIDIEIKKINKLKKS